MSRELLLARICEKEKLFHLVLENYGGQEELRVGAAVQMHAVICQRVHWMNTKYLENKLDFYHICLLTGFKWRSYFKVEEKYIQFI